MRKSLKWAGITRVRLLEHLTSRQAKAMNDGEMKLNPHFSTGDLLSTLVPLHRRVQDFIDRRFYRRMYDAENALADFAAAARNEIDLGRLSRLTGTIQDAAAGDGEFMDASDSPHPTPTLPSRLEDGLNIGGREGGRGLPLPAFVFERVGEGGVGEPGSAKFTN